MSHDPFRIREQRRNTLTVTTSAIRSNMDVCRGYIFNKLSDTNEMREMRHPRGARTYLYGALAQGEDVKHTSYPPCFHASHSSLLQLIPPAESARRGGLVLRPRLRLLLPQFERREGARCKGGRTFHGEIPLHLKQGTFIAVCVVLLALRKST